MEQQTGILRTSQGGFVITAHEERLKYGGETLRLKHKDVAEIIADFANRAMVGNTGQWKAESV